MKRKPRPRPIEATEEERQRFKKQYPDDKWQTLMKSPQFRDAWERRDVIEAGEVASRLIEGDFSSAQSARLWRELRA